MDHEVSHYVQFAASVGTEREKVDCFSQAVTNIEPLINKEIEDPVQRINR